MVAYLLSVGRVVYRCHSVHCSAATWAAVNARPSYNGINWGSGIRLRQELKPEHSPLMIPYWKRLSILNIKGVRSVVGTLMLWRYLWILPRCESALLASLNYLLERELIQLLEEKNLWCNSLSCFVIRFWVLGVDFKYVEHNTRLSLSCLSANLLISDQYDGRTIPIGTVLLIKPWRSAN